MFYRRKVILSLLQLFDGQLEKIRLQKLLFLFTKQQEKSEYDFVPYKFGCYSFSAKADLTAMVAKGMLGEDEKTVTKTDNINYLTTLKESDKKLAQQIKQLYGKMDTKALTKHTYINFPYWATKSEIAGKLLNEVELNKVIKTIPNGNKTILFTIGYEGISLEEYLNRLLINDVKILVDVRNNPLSMKFGFSKSLLKKYCESLGIQYMHFPDVGIQSSQRQELNTQSDYDKLFTAYRKENLTKTIPTQNILLNLLIKNKRIALTCFEANICQCHRKYLAESIANFPNFKYETKHI